MDIPPYVYISIITAIVSVSGAWAIVKYRLDKSEKTDDSQWTVITKIRDWQTKHIEDSLTVRIGYEKRMAEIDSGVREVKTQHSDIMKRMDLMDVKLDRLFELLSKNRN